MACNQLLCWWLVGNACVRRAPNYRLVYGARKGGGLRARLCARSRAFELASVAPSPVWLRLACANELVVTTARRRADSLVAVKCRDRDRPTAEDIRVLPSL